MNGNTGEHHFLENALPEMTKSPEGPGNSVGSVAH